MVRATAWLRVPVLCHASAGRETSLTEFYGQEEQLSVLQPDLPKGDQLVPAWHCQRSYHLIWHGSPLPAPQAGSVLFQFLGLSSVLVFLGGLQAAVSKAGVTAAPLVAFPCDGLAAGRGGLFVWAF